MGATPSRSTNVVSADAVYAAPTPPATTIPVDADRRTARGRVHQGTAPAPGFRSRSDALDAAASAVQRAERIRGLTALLLAEVDGDPTRADLQDTPARVARWWGELLAGATDDNVSTTFDGMETDQMVVLSGVRVWTLCEHHLLPFYCDLAIGYLTAGKLLGLSKLARIARREASRLNTQERLVTRIADAVQAVTGSPDVAVVARGEHLCMTMRGVRTPGVMSSSAIRGAFREPQGAARAEFFTLAKL